eukprot:m.260141 g.260141  ORF g.260141 m.260141 type:complete len:194 (+) comp23342_c0_seq1:335-916(+)
MASSTRTSTIGQAAAHSPAQPAAASARGSPQNSSSTAPTRSRHTVVAIDESPASAAALAYAVEHMCQGPGDTLHLVHAYPRYTTYDALYFTAPQRAPLGDEEAIRRSRNEWLQSIVSETRLVIAGRCSCDGVIGMGDAREVIASVANRFKASSIVVGSRGLGAVKRALLGSVSSHLVNFSPQPVIVVKSEQIG